VVDEGLVPYSSGMEPVLEDSTPRLAPASPLLVGIVAAALTAGYANLAAGALDQPRAFESITALFLPLALGVGALLVVSFLGLLLVGRALRLCGVSEVPALVAIGVFIVLAAGLSPLVEGLARNLSGEHRLLFWGIVGVAGICAATLAGGVTGWMRRDADRARRVGALLCFGGPFVAVEGLFVVWILLYPLAQSSPMVRAAIAGGWLIAVGVSFVILWRNRLPLRLLPLLATLLVVTLASPILSLLAGDDALPARADLPPGQPRHVVLITVDTLRPDMIGVEREGVAISPAIDALLADSTVFTRARAAAPWTKPSVASILTGLSPLVHGATHRTRILPPEVHTLAEYLRDAGYTTIGVGLNVHLEPIFRFHQGFDEYWFPARNDWGIALGARILEQIDGHRWPEIFPTSTAIADRAIERIAKRTDEPFFLWVHLLDPHWPYAPPAEFVPPRDPASGIGARWGEHEMVTDVQAGSTKLGAADQERVRDLYRGEIAYVDRNIARLIGFLKEEGIYDEALIAFTSDHGEEFWEHGGFEHGHTMFDEVLRVPLAFKIPGQSGGAPVDAIVSNESLTPTMLDLIGHENRRGTFTSPSLASWLDGGAGGEEPGPIFSAATYYHGEKRAVIFDGLKAVLELDTGRMQLYELTSDPAEMSSVSSSRPEAVQRAAELLRARAEEAMTLREAMGLREDATVEAGGAIDRLLEDLGYAGGSSGD
jgi:arylsulfatase A-like enzyme